MSRSRAACGWLIALGLLAGTGCGRDTSVPDAAVDPSSSGSSTRSSAPSILLVTLDTVRADDKGLAGAATPHLDALMARARVFEQAYATAPTTLPAHASMLTGLYPAEHGVHENARRLASEHPRLATHLSRRGYRTAAFVSGVPLAREFGLATGFDHYDDTVAPAAERRAEDTTERALAYLGELAPSAAPLFLWLHYFDAHEPYDPPEPFRSRHADPYLGEIAYLDEQVGRLFDAWKRFVAPARAHVIVAADHGEGRGDHGEALHGNLVYQGVMRVPLIVAAPGVGAGRETTPVSTRRIFDTVLAWAGENRPAGLIEASEEAVLGEAMKPFLQYGWQPQVMGVMGRQKVIRSGDFEAYDVIADPAESENLWPEREPDRALMQAIRAYPFVPPGADGPSRDTLTQEQKERLASLGYVSWEGRSELRPEAPSPRAMTHLFADLDLGSGLFVAARYREVVPVFTRVLEADPYNLMVALRLAVALSFLGDVQQADRLFARARSLAPSSLDVRHYEGQHRLRVGALDEAAVLLASVLAEAPERMTTRVALARTRLAQGRPADAIGVLEAGDALDRLPAAGLVLLGEARMGMGRTTGAIEAFERAWASDRAGFGRWLELGVLYLADRRFEEARDALDRIAEDDPGYAMALFKRAQVSVLLGEPDAAARIAEAERHADDMTRELIVGEALFRGLP